MGSTHILASVLPCSTLSIYESGSQTYFLWNHIAQLILSGNEISEITEGRVNLLFLDKRIFHVHLALPILYCTSTGWACGHALRMPKRYQNPYCSIYKDIKLSPLLVGVYPG